MFVRDMFKCPFSSFVSLVMVPLLLAPHRVECCSFLYPGARNEPWCDREYTQDPLQH